MVQPTFFGRQLKLKGTAFNRLLGFFTPVFSQRRYKIPKLFHTRKFKPSEFIDNHTVVHLKILVSQ